MIKIEIMAFTLHISDSSNPKVLAFMEYVKSLDFVNVIEDEIVKRYNEIEELNKQLSNN